MLKNIKYNSVCQKFHRGINRIYNNEIIDIAITSFGGFTDAFTEGVGRRVEIKEDECELSVNTVAEINNKIFHFSRCYTHLQLDTKDLDKKQDIVKYANELNKSLKDQKIILPIIAYYNESTEFEDSYSRYSQNNTMSNRDCGYSNCLIVKNKFNPTQDFFKIISFIAWQKSNMNIQDDLVNHYYTAINHISNALRKIGYDGIVFDPVNDCLLVSKNNEYIELVKLKKDYQIYTAIVFDLNMRSLMLNPYCYNPFNVEGCIGITYKFEKDKMLSNLVCTLSKQFPKIQILI